jgi:RHS repeat-associated protein
MKNILYILLITVFVFIAEKSTAQIQGLSTAYVGETKTYTYDNGNLLSNPKWTTPSGTVKALRYTTSPYYRVNITWATAGTFTIIFSADGEIYLTKTVTITTPPPVCSIGVPSSSSISRCGPGVVDFLAYTGAGATVKWYSAASGGTLLNTGLVFSPLVSVTTTFYISSYNDDTKCESSRVAVTATIKALPSVCIARGKSSCLPAEFLLTVVQPPDATAVRWYSTEEFMASGEQFETPRLTSTTTYYVCSYNSTTGCESDKNPVVVTITGIPAAPTVTGNIYFEGQPTPLTASGTLLGGTYNWYAPNSTTPLFTGNPYVTPVLTQSKENYVNVSAIKSTCESAKTPVAITIIPKPTINASSFYIAKGESVTLSFSPVNYDSYVWKKVNSDGTLTDIGTSLSYTTNQIGTFVLKVTKNGMDYTTSPVSIKTQFEEMDLNYVTTNTFQNDALPLHTIIDNQPVETITQSIQYFDGFGRPMQAVSTQGSPTKKDIVQPVIYNWFGLEEKKFLPFVSEENNGRYKNSPIGTGIYSQSPHYKFYSNGLSDKIADDPSPFSTTVFDGNPLKAIVKQGAPGAAWQPNADRAYTSTDKSIKKSYEFNSATEVLLFDYIYPSSAYPLGFIKIGKTVYHPAKQLLKVSTKDEQGNEVVEFTNKDGQIILKKVQVTASAYAQTYYVYDDFGNLVFVLQPEGTQAIIKNLPITWANKVGVSADLNTNILTKTGVSGYPTGAYMTGSATSTYITETLSAATDGWVEIIATETDKSRMIGLSATHSFTTNIQFAVELRNDGKVYVWENNTPKPTSIGNYTTGTVVRVSREASQIKYYIDGVLKMTSSLLSTGTLIVSAALNETNSTFGNVNISFKVNASLQQFLSSYAFQYTYDSRQRMSQKLVPGGGVVYMVYDGRDRLVLTQDANQRIINNWSFTKYDALDRPVLTGIKDTTATVSQTDMQTVVNTYYELAKTTKPWRKFYETFTGASGANFVQGYTNLSYPQTTSTAVPLLDVNKYLTVSYYDNYSFLPLWQGTYTYVNDGLKQVVGPITYNQPVTSNIRTTGVVTGSKIKVLDGGITGGYTWLKSLTYYDDKYRVIQTQADNYKCGVDRVSNLYDFTGKILQTRSTYVESDVTWKDQTGVSIIGNKLTSTSSATAGSASVQQLAPGQTGWIEFVVSETSTNRYIGFNNNNPDVGFDNLDYAFYLMGKTLKVIENNIVKQTLTDVLQSGDVLKIVRTGSTVKYYRNNIVIALTVASTPVPASTMFMVDVSMQSSGATLVGVRTSFSTNTKTVTRRFDYDHAARLLRTWHQLDTQPEILLINNEYNELGQLVDKKLHSTVATAANAKQSIDYRYNIRGWLTNMNDASLTQDGADPKDYFGMELGYNTDLGVTNVPLYNGNISAMKWSKNQGLGGVNQLAYTYSYDAMNRIADATFKEKNSTWTAPVNNGFSEKAYSYDLNGNLKSLQRWNTSTATLMDNLTYDYGTATSNRLLKVNDWGNKMMGFVDGTNAAGVDDYTYDKNGNMTLDQNKGITTAIVYNFLNLPELVTRGGNTVCYIYDATGRKLAQVVTFNSELTTYTGVQKQTDYCGELIYENDVLQFISHEEGRIVIANTKLIYNDACESTTNMVASNATLSKVTQNGVEKYIKVVSDGTTARTGIFPIGGTSYVVPGERYRIRAKGYRDKGTATASSQVHLLIQVNGVTDLNWPGAALPVSLTTAQTESWIEQVVTIPGTGTTPLPLQVGVVWNTVLAGEIFFLNEFEITKLSTNATPEYQYNLKDHLGNVRVTFTTKDETDVSLATMETANVNTEKNQFLYYEEAVKVNQPIFDHTNQGPTYYSTRLTGGNTNAKYGLTKTLSVMAGDVVNLEVFAKYLDQDQTTWSQALKDFMLSISNGTAATGTFIDGGVAGSIGSGTFPITVLNHSTETGTPPKAYLNYIMFDRDYNPILADVTQTNYVRVSTNARETGSDGNHEQLSASIAVKQPGYLYIYLSNENPTAVEVYFDDFKVTHIKSPVIETQDYYPFGLTYNSYGRENTLCNRWKFQGQEHVGELGLNWDSFKWRNHQPDIGRFFNIDPLADKYVYNSPYAFSENHVISHVELEGLEKVSIQQSLGNNYRYYNAYNIQRQTTGGKRFSENLASQSKLNVLYFMFTTAAEDGITKKVTSMDHFKAIKKRRPDLYQGLNDKEVQLAMGNNELILVGIDGSLVEKDDSGFEGAACLNHEEMAHADDIVDGDENDVYEDHGYYYGYEVYYSPSNEDVLTKPRYNNSRAKKQFQMILRQIKNNKMSDEKKETKPEEKAKEKRNGNNNFTE